MEKRDLFSARDFFSKEFIFGNPHSVNCDCDVCLEADALFDKLSLIADNVSSEKIISTESKKICDLLSSDALGKLNCGNGTEFAHLQETYEQIWDSDIEGKPAASLSNNHKDSCDCIVCSIKKEVIFKLDNLCSESLDESDLLDIIDEQELQPLKQVKLPDAKIEDGGESAHENVCSTSGDSLDKSKLVDICLCEKGTFNPYCLKHCVAYCQHMQTKLYEEGCTCTRDAECLFCQRLKCNYCSHERTLPATCPFINDEETNELTLKVSSWLDDKLLEVGVSPELIKKFSEPIDQLKTEKFREDIKTEDMDLPKLLAQHIDRNVIKKQVLNCNTVDNNYVITDDMKSEILNMDNLFDIRPFPRCYRLKGVKDGEGAYSSIKEEYMDHGFLAWKLPTQSMEDILPLGSSVLDVETRLEKEEEIMKKSRNLRPSTVEKKVKVTGLTDDWRPVVEETLDGSDYREMYTLEDKIAWADKAYIDIIDKCKDLWEPEDENTIWSRIQPILDKYGEETMPLTSSSMNEQESSKVDLEQILQDASEFAKKVTNKYKNSGTIGFKPEFWKGLENWRPPTKENEVHKRLIDEVTKFSKELYSYMNDYERALTDRPGIEVNVDETVETVIASLPTDLGLKIQKVKSELPSAWLSNPESVLVQLKNSSVQPKLVLPESKTLSDTPTFEKVQTERTISECDSIQLSDDDGPDHFADKPEAFFYDDEEQAEELKKVNEEKESKAEVTDESEPTKSRQAHSVLQEFPSNLKSSFMNSTTPRPAPYVQKLKEDMLKNSPNGLHPTQQLWFDRPMFPFWTPSIIYDISDIEKLFFDGVPEYKLNIDEVKLKEFEDRILLNRQTKVINKELGKTEESENESKDDSDSTNQLKETCVEKVPEEDTKAKSNKKSKVKKVGKAAAKSVSNADCLIKEDDFKAAIEELLKTQALKNDAIKEEEIGEAGALSLDQIKKGVAGRVKACMKGAIQLDSNLDFDLESIVPCPAFKYPFKLDIFQKQAIIALEAGLSVFVAAHTSAGKTVAAEYAIAMAMRSGCRVVYTSPIKALSNQKYNDFTKKFKGQMKVGIITGDVQLNIEAECLIMTTEILRSMLYNQSSILSDLEYVIFDEVHYFNDPERGNVWEEVLILLPHQCQLVMLSATVPNVMNFASWVGTLRKREVIVASTSRRPVPLKHYIHFSTSPEYVSTVLPVKEAEGPFLLKNFEKAMRLKELEKHPKCQSIKDKQKKDWNQFILHHLKRHQRLPAVIFCFSRRRCDELALSILKCIDLVEDKKKKKHIENFFNRQINMLQPEDRDIEQIVTMKSLLQIGVGVHHSGILPILKEIVEVLFSESQIKLLFATETFAMGVNMPAKTVVFQQVKKYDGNEVRPLKPGEYTQMAGRAGRRGIDKSGTVIVTEWNHRVDKFIDQNDLSNMLTGKVDSLQSQFRLRYSMILMALKPEGENSIQSIIQKSFFDFSLKAQKDQTQLQTEKVYDELMKINEEMRHIPFNLRDALNNYCSIVYQTFNHHDNIREKMFEHKRIKEFLTIGQLVRISFYRYVNVFGIILNVDQVTKTYDIAVTRSSKCLIKSIKEKYECATHENIVMWFRLVGFRKMELLPLSHICFRDSLESFELIQCKASNILRIVRNPHHKINKAVANSIIDTLRSSSRLYNQHVENMGLFFKESVMNNLHNLVYLNEDDINFNNPTLRVDVINYHKHMRAFEENLFHVAFPSHSNYPLLDYLEKCYWLFEKQRDIEKRKIQSQKEDLKSLSTDFESKLEFLKNNKYIKKDDDVVDTKGRIASRLTNFEVFVTEILLKNVLEDLDGAETAALLSCLVLPSVSTDVTDNDNQINPLFKPIVDFDQMIEAEHNKSGRGGGNQMSRQDYKNKKIELAATVRDIGVRKDELEATNRLIIEYLDLPDTLRKALDTVEEIQIELINQEDLLKIEPMEGSDLSKITFYLVPIVYAWAKGKPMRQIMQVLVPNIQEGILVRWIIHLHEAIKNIDSATHHFLKDSRIKEKFESASASIKRGIIDTPSLYLNQRTQTT